MLYDPKWEITTKLTLDNLIAWLETKDADGEYCWKLPSSCLLMQWLQSYGDAKRDYTVKDDRSMSFKYKVNGVAVDVSQFCSVIAHSTYGEALAAAKLEKKQPTTTGRA
jgi:hypothetical protein